MRDHSPPGKLHFHVRTMRTSRTHSGIALKIRHLNAGYSVRSTGAQMRTVRTEWPVRTVRSASEPLRTAVAAKYLRHSSDLGEPFARFAVFARQVRYGRNGGKPCLG